MARIKILDSDWSKSKFELRLNTLGEVNQIQLDEDEHEDKSGCSLVTVYMEAKSDPFIFTCEDSFAQNNVANLIDGYCRHGL